MMKSSFWKFIVVLGAIIVGAALLFPKALRGKSEKTAPVQVQKEVYPLDVAQITIDVGVDTVLANKLLDVKSDIRKAFQTNKVSLSSPINENVTKDALLISFTAAVDVSAGLALIDSQFRHTDANGADLGALVKVSQVEGLNYQIELTDAVKARMNDQTVMRSIEVLRRRIDPDSKGGVNLQKTGNNLIVLQLLDEAEGVSQDMKDRITASANLGFHTVVEASAVELDDCVQKEICPVGTKLFFDEFSQANLLVVARPVLANADLKQASAGFAQHTGQPIVSFTYNYEGSTKFCEYTKTHIDQRFAIVINEKIISAPVIREPICGGSGYIEGGFTVKEATELALLLNAGALPTKLRVVEIKIVTIEAPANTKE